MTIYSVDNIEYIHMYGGTCLNDHLYTKTTCPRCPLLDYSLCPLNYSKESLYKTTCLQCPFPWSLACGLCTQVHCTCICTYCMYIVYSIDTTNTYTCTYVRKCITYSMHTTIHVHMYICIWVHTVCTVYVL